MSDPLDDKKSEVDHLDLDQRYLDWQALGQGGMGQVFLALDQMLDKRVAIKLLHSDVDSRAVVRFQQEAKVLSKLSHKFIVKIMDFHYSKSGQLFLVMEHVDGSNLESILEEKKRLPPEEALRITIQLSQALEHAHKQGIVHRDLKPANVMLDGEQNAKILDFGIAKLVSGSEIFGTLTKAGQIIGSPMYMSPEQLRGETANELSDVYGLGLLLFTMIVGHPPFDGSNLMDSLQQRLKQLPPTVLTYVEDPKLCAGLDAIIRRALNPDTNERYATMSDFEADLLALQAATAQPADIITTAVNKRLAVKLSKKQILSGAIFALLLMFAASIGMAIKFKLEQRIDATVSDTTPIEVMPDVSEGKALRPKGGGSKNKRPPPRIGRFTSDEKHKVFRKAPDPLTKDALKQLQEAKVRNLSFDGSKSFTTDILKQLPAPELKELKGLSLCNTQISDKDLKELSKIENLVWLDLSDTAVSDKGIKYLKPLHKLFRLELKGCKGITNSVIPTLEQFPKLRFLDISNTRVTRDGVIGLQKFPELIKVGFGGLNITDDDIIGFKNLVVVNLDNCPNITDKAVNYLAEQESVRSLDVSRCPQVTVDAMGNFRRLKPGEDFKYAPPKHPVNTDKHKEMLEMFTDTDN